MSSLIANFSPHIFWDVDVHSIDMEKNGAFVLQRVLQYGILKDWLLLKWRIQVINATCPLLLIVCKNT